MFLNDGGVNLRLPDTRADSYTRKLHTRAGDVEVKMRKLRNQTFETAIIERYRRRYFKNLLNLF